MKTFYRNRNWEKLKQSISEQLELSAKLRDTKSIARALEYRAAYFKKTNRIDSALYYYNISQKLYQHTKDSLNEGLILLNIAIIQKRFRAYPESIDNLKKALTLVRRKATPRRISSIYNSLGIAYGRMKEYDSAIAYHEKAMRIRKKMDDRKYLVHTMNNLGKIHLDKAEYDKAFGFLKKAQSFDSILRQDQRIRATVVDNLSYTKAKLGDTTNVATGLLEALSIRESTGDPHSKVMSYIHLADFYDHSKNKKLALHYAKRIKHNIDAINDHEDLLGAYELLISTLEGDEQKETFARYKTIRDSLDLIDLKKLEKYYGMASVVDEQRSTIAQQKQRVSRLEKNRSKIVLLSLIGIGFLGFVAFRVTQQKRKQKRLLLKAKENLSESKEQVAASRQALQESEVAIQQKDSQIIQMAYRGDVDRENRDLFHEALSEKLGLKNKDYLLKHLTLAGAGKTQSEIAELQHVALVTVKKRSKKLRELILPHTDATSTRGVKLKEFYILELKSFHKRLRNQG